MGRTFPPIAIAVPPFEIWTDIGLYDTYLGLILPSLAFGCEWDGRASPGVA